MTRQIACEWCIIAAPATEASDAAFVVVGGDYRTGTVSDWFICLDHADSINETRECYTVPTIPVTIIDVYLINWINHQARDYYFNRWATDD